MNSATYPPSGPSDYIAILKYHKATIALLALAGTALALLLLIGFLAGAICFLAIALKFRFRYDDALDVIAVHLVGGALGSVLLGLFADAGVNDAGKDGVLFGGGWSLFGEQVLAVAAVLVYSFVVSLVIGLALKAMLPKGIRVKADEEDQGLDLTQHSETGYSLEFV